MSENTVGNSTSSSSSQGTTEAASKGASLSSARPPETGSSKQSAGGRDGRSSESPNAVVDAKPGSADSAESPEPTFDVPEDVDLDDPKFAKLLEKAAKWKKKIS